MFEIISLVHSTFYIFQVYHVRAGMVRFDTPITVQVLKLYPQMWDDQPMISSPLMEGCRMHKKQPGRGNKTNSTTKNGH